MALNIGNKVYRNLQEQVGYNSEQIDKIFSILDGIDYEDHVVVIDDISIPLNEDEMAIIVEPVSFLVYQNKLYFKDSADSEKIYFSAVVEITDTDLITIRSSQISVDLESSIASPVSASHEIYSAEETDNKISELQALILNIPDGSPKGVYATLADLQTAFPTGSSGVYIVSADGHWYYWNGNAWTDGGLYQSAQIADYSIDYIKTNFVTRGKNLYNKNTSIEGYYIGYSSGSAFPNASFFASDYIEIDSSKGYVCLNIYSAFQLAFYDNSKTYISGAYYTSNPDGVIEIPINAKYVRFSERKEDKNQMQLEYGQTITQYQEYQYKFSIEKPSSQEAEEVNLENSVSQKVNLIDYTDNTINKYYGNVSATFTGTSCWIINSFIKLKPNTKYSIYPKNAFYEAFTWLTKSPQCTGDQSKVENFGYSNSTGCFTTDNEHIFLYITLKTAPTESMKLIEGDMTNTNIAFGDKVLFGNFNKKTFYVGPNRQFTKLKDGVEYASQFPNALLIVDDGTYDLVSEYGQDYLDNTNSDTGLVLKNGLHIKFSSKSKVVFNYNGSNAFIHTDFSPFNTGIYGGTLENMTLECSNCRYAIHDERGNSEDRYENRYINCVMSLDNSQNPDWINPQNIGGGLGQDGYIEIIGCIFNNAVTYHNNHTGSTQSKSKVIIKDCYLQNNGIIIQGYNASITEKSVFIVTNTHTDYIDVQTTIDNVICYQWNNDIY